KTVADKAHRHTPREKERSIEASVAPPLHERRAVRFEFLNAGITRIGNIEVAFLIRRDAPGHIELAHVCASPGKSEFSPRLHDGAVEIAFLHSVVSAVGD